MTSTSTYAWDPTGGNLVINAFAKGAGLKQAELTAEHIRNAVFEANLLNVDISNRNPNMFALETQTQVLTTAAAYTLANRTLAIAVAYVTSSASSTQDRILGAISASDYSSITDKTQTSGSGPTSYFLSLLKVPTITVWPLIAAADTATYTLSMLTFRQNQDFEAKSGYTTDLPYRFLDAFSTGLSARLADIYKPERADRLYALYERKFALCAAGDQEDVPIAIVPGLQGYFS